MTTKQDILAHVTWMKEKYDGIGDPIYLIVVFQNPDNMMIGRDGKPLDWPDEGAMDEVGFYYNIDMAIHAMHENWTDLHEYTYFAGFVICKFQGLYSASIPSTRIYFKWDEERQGFFEADEPEIFRHVSY